MADFQIQNAEQARAIIAAFEKCSICFECPLHTPEGWRCDYLYKTAKAYLDKHNAR